MRLRKLHNSTGRDRSPARFQSGRRTSPQRALRSAAFESLEGRRLLSFSASVDYPVGTNPLAVVGADFNGDGRDDLATANNAGNSVSVLLSNANGTFAPAQAFPAGIIPRSLAVGDVNGDSKRDLVVANSIGLSVLLGNGDGSFQSPQSVGLPDQTDDIYGTGSHPQTGGYSVAVGDLNADGKLDLVATGQTQFEIHYTGYYGGDYVFSINHAYVNVLLGNGSGGFASSSAYRQNSQPLGLGIADFNNDNKPDVMTSGNGVGLMLGNGNGTLQPLVSNGYGSTVPAPVGDFNGDGKLDIMVPNGSVQLVLLKGQGDGTFQTPVTIPVVGSVRSIVAGDLNGDGKLDVVVNTAETHYSSYGYYGGYDPVTTDSTKVLLGYGDGTFAQPITTITGSHAGYMYGNAAALADFNGDARPDLATAEIYSSLVTVRLNANDWVLPAAVSISDATVTEGDTGTVNAVFTVSLSKVSTQTVTVQYAAASGLAVVARDFDALSGTLTFAPGETSKTISVAVRSDLIDEYDETFAVNLTAATNADLADGQGLGTIVDNDPPPNITISDVSGYEGRSGSTPFNFRVSLSAPSEKDVMVNYATANGTAQTSDGDYLANSGTLVISAGQTSRTIAVTVRGDKRKENTETFSLNLSGASNGTITDAQAIGTILNDDPPNGKGKANNVVRNTCSR